MAVSQRIAAYQSKALQQLPLLSALRREVEGSRDPSEHLTCSLPQRVAKELTMASAPKHTLRNEGFQPTFIKEIDLLLADFDDDCEIQFKFDRQLTSDEQLDFALTGRSPVPYLIEIM